VGEPIAIKRKTPAARPGRGRPRLIKGLQITAAASGYIVYDHGRERVHYLNHTAGVVMDLCTGDNSTSEIVGLVKQAFALPRKPTREVAAVLKQLSAEGLVTLTQ
jgi:hypothetical protein